MVSPIQFTNQKISFKGNEDLISAPGAFEQTTQTTQAIPETPEDEFILSGNPDAPKKKGSALKTVAKTIGAVVVIAGGFFGLYKWKGVNGNWLNKDASDWGGKIKNALVKPGEWLEDLFKGLGEKLGISGERTSSRSKTPKKDLIQEPEPAPSSGTEVKIDEEIPVETPAPASPEVATGNTPKEEIITPVE